MTIVTRLLISDVKHFSEKDLFRFVLILRFEGVIAEDEHNIIITDHVFSVHQENLKIMDDKTIVHNGFYFGHYFNNLHDAIADYYERKRICIAEIPKNLELH